MAGIGQVLFLRIYGYYMGRNTKPARQYQLVQSANGSSCAVVTQVPEHLPFFTLGLYCPLAEYFQREETLIR